MMEGKVWRRPLTEVQKFEANEYVAACESGTTYWFECNAGYNDLVDSYHYWVEDENGKSLTGVMGGYKPCGTTHEVKKTDKFIVGYIDDKWTPKDEHMKVLIWRGENGNDIHCTTKLNPENWEIAKS